MCGIFGIANHSDPARMAYLGLYALQHRGQESTGMSSSDGNQVYTHKAMGYVADVYDEDVFAKLKGSNAIGHTRYSTAGESSEGNAQPIVVKCTYGTVALVHNGRSAEHHPCCRALQARRTGGFEILRSRRGRR